MQHERHGEYELLQSNAAAEEPPQSFCGTIAVRVGVREERDDVAGKQRSRYRASGSTPNNRVSDDGKLALNFIS